MRTLQYKGYRGRAELDPDTGIFHGEVLGTRDVLTFQATREDELEPALRESVEDYLAFCTERGEQPNPPSG